MIVRPSVHWLRMLFVWRGSILPVILPQLITITVLAIVVTVIHGSILDWKVSLNFVPFSLIGLTLAIFLGFRNSTSYARFWEARTLWGVLLVESRHLTAQALAVVGDEAVDRAHAKLLAQRLCAFAYALKHQLRESDARAELSAFLPPGDVERIAGARFPAAMALLLVQEWVGEQLRSGKVAAAVVPALEQSLARLGNAVGGCERISGTPIPFTYSVILHRCVYIYCFLLPFGLLDTIGPMTPVIVCFLGYTFFALEALGAELEHPFGLAANDLALGSLCYTIESSVLEMVGEPPRTAKPEVRDCILL
ncbi:bestrophin family protein [Comamonas odontotermitis]|uniref:bestrophin family protein n=1 Tax=Comamonas odontotermitis TaxID=379895 RepID=UPI0037536EEA